LALCGSEDRRPEAGRQGWVRLDWAAEEALGSVDLSAFPAAASSVVFSEHSVALFFGPILERVQA